MKNIPLFERLLELSAKNNTFKKRTFESLEWHRKHVKELMGDKFLDTDRIFEKRNYPNYPIPGNIITFRYNPKGKATLPYYDRFPLVLILKLTPKGFIGLNFHYLHPRHRAYFMDRLYKYEKYNKIDKTMKINITYNQLVNNSKMQFFKPCIKRYITANIGNMIITLMPNEWDIALFLPTEKFIGEDKETVWKDSTKIIDD